MLVSINGTDITRCINESTYAVAQNDVFEEWTDANFKKHRVVTRQKVSGSFDVVFAGSATMAFSDFKTAMSVRDSAGSILMNVYVQNLDEVKPIRAYVTVTAKKYAEVSNSVKLQKFTINFEEQ